MRFFFISVNGNVFSHIVSVISFVFVNDYDLDMDLCVWNKVKIENQIRTWDWCDLNGWCHLELAVWFSCLCSLCRWWLEQLGTAEDVPSSRRLFKSGCSAALSLADSPLCCSFAPLPSALVLYSAPINLYNTRTCVFTIHAHHTNWHYWYPQPIL